MGAPVFDLERLEADGDRLQVAGRWSGVRGMRFVRPALVLRSDEGERTLLADLEHKPWAPEEGREWVASFPWTGGPVEAAQAELAVAPSIVVPLARAEEGAGPAAPPLYAQLEEERARVRRLEAEVTWLREQRETLTADLRQLRDERAAAAGDLEAAREARDGEADELRRELAALRDERATLERDRHDLALERDAAAANLEAVLRERDEAGAAAPSADELDGLRRERDEARAAAEKAPSAGELEAVRRERDTLRRELEAVRGERDAVLRELHDARRERDDALEEPSGIQPARITDAPAPARRRPRLVSDERTRPGREDWLARAMAIGALLSLLLLLVGLLRLF
ncbi:MAG: hypothetical protein HZB46_05335 [Solirubrobacterales bacterium]|nr:hypothetical protein [Solirubrobacterales bacterium]